MSGITYQHQRRRALLLVGLPVAMLVVFMAVTVMNPHMVSPHLVAIMNPHMASPHLVTLMNPHVMSPHS